MTGRYRNALPAKALAVAVMAIAGLGVAACEQPKGYGDPRETYPLEVKVETVSVSVGDRADGGPMHPLEQVGFERFVKAYFLRGKSQVTMQAFASDGTESDHAARYQRIYGLLRKVGIDSRQVVVAPGKKVATGPAWIVLSFAASSVEPPECGDWSSTATNEWSNRRHSNFGCSYRRNLGLTIADPGDLKSGQPMSHFEGSRGAAGIGTLRSGASGAAATTTTGN